MCSLKRPLACKSGFIPPSRRFARPVLGLVLGNSLNALEEAKISVNSWVINNQRENEDDIIED